MTYDRSDTDRDEIYEALELKPQILAEHADRLLRSQRDAARRAQR